MEIPRYIRYVFSSPENRRRMNERKKIVQGMVNTIVNHIPQESSTSRPDTSKEALYRGTLLGWVVLSALSKNPVFTSHDCYSPYVAHFTTNFDLANQFPHYLHPNPELPLKPALRKMRKREGLRMSIREQKELYRRLSRRVTVQVEPRDINPHSSIRRYLDVNHDVVQEPIENLSRWSIDHFNHQIGVNPIDIVRKLANL